MRLARRLAWRSAQQLDQPAGAPVGQAQGLGQCGFIGGAKIEHHRAVQLRHLRQLSRLANLCCGLQRVGQPGMAQLVAPHHALTLAQRLGGNVAQVAQVAVGGVGGGRRKAAVGLGQQQQRGA